MGTNNKPKPDIQPKPSDDACYVFQQGEFSKNDASHGVFVGSDEGHQVFCLMNKGIPEVLRTMRATKVTGNCKLFAYIPD